jgi:hypothetical protein
MAPSPKPASIIALVAAIAPEPGPRAVAHPARPARSPRSKLRSIVRHLLLAFFEKSGAAPNLPPLMILGIWTLNLPAKGL